MALDDADKKVLADMLADALKPDVLAKALGPAVGQLVTAALKPINERLDRADQAAKAAAEKAEADAKAAAEKAEAEAGKKGNEPPQPDQKLLTELAQLRAGIEKERKAREDAEAASKREALDRTLRDQLTAQGVPADNHRAALALLREEGALVEHDGKPHWKGKVGDVEGLHALDAGIKSWLGGAGKIFVPAAPVKPSGSEAGQRSTASANGAQVDWSKLGGMLRPNAIQ